MKYKWLNKSNNKKLIVFFNGWGMDEKVVSHLSFNDFDVLMFYNYTDTDKSDFDFSNYEYKILLAWSMGVYVSNIYYETFKGFDKYIAINGTQKPIDDDYGIPEAVYNLTAENFNEFSKEKFIKKITTHVDLKKYTTRSTEELKSELIAIRDLKPEKYLKFNKAVISTKDRIMPYKNQLRFWSEKDIEITELDAPHYIFNFYTKWEELL